MPQATEKMQPDLSDQSFPRGRLAVHPVPSSASLLSACLGYSFFPLGLAFPKCKRKGLFRAFFFSLNILYSRGRPLIFHRLVASAHAGCREIKAELGGRVSGGWLPGPRDLPTPPLQPAWPSGDPPVPQSAGLHGLQCPRLL